MELKGMLDAVRGFLIDLDGVVYIDRDLVPGAVDSIRHLKGEGFSYRFVTNTTNKSRASIGKKIEGFGIETSEQEIFSTPYAAARLLLNRGTAKCWVLTRGDAVEEFRGLELTSEDPDFIILGDLMHEFTFELLNEVFRKLLAGAELIALQKNRYWLTGGKLTLDAGPFVAALEYASGKTARVVGKPSREFFELALADLGLGPNQVVMIGDDIEADIRGAQEAGLKTVLVKTGKYRPEDVLKTGIKPDTLIESIAELPRLLHCI
jgi:HAD superfamily hydrolase (TIGR01458 family)